jgi:replicative DNA helicase
VNIKRLIQDVGKLEPEEKAAFALSIAGQLESDFQNDEPFKVVTGEELRDSVLELRRLKATHALEGFSTGYPGLDSYSGGWRKGEFVVIAADSNIGKSWFALNVAHNMATSAGAIKSIYGSFEMPDRVVVNRLAMIHEGMGENFENSFALPVHLPAHGVNRDGTLERYITKAAKEGYQVFYVDNLNDLPSVAETKRFSHGEWSRRFKELSKELEIVIVMLHHTRRGGGGEKTADDLAESKDIENHADHVYILNRDKKANDSKLVVSYEKSRNGTGLGKVELEIGRGWFIQESVLNAAEKKNLSTATQGVFG